MLEDHVRSFLGRANLNRKPTTCPSCFAEPPCCHPNSDDVKTTVIFGFVDPATVPLTPGWPLRNLLTLLANRWGLTQVSWLACCSGRGVGVGTVLRGGVRCLGAVAAGHRAVLSRARHEPGPRRHGRGALSTRGRGT
jgi:hypothetical protein